MIYFAFSLAAVSVICIYLLFRLFSLKKNLRNISENLKNTRQAGYNRMLTVNLHDRELEELSSEINNNLRFQKKLKIHYDDTEKNLKKSVSDIAHDFRTPLTVIKGNLQLIQSDTGMSDKSRELLGICLNKTDALKIIADDFFEISLLESDDSPCETEKTDATEAFLRFLADHEGFITSHVLTPEIDFPEKSIFINADRQMLSRMMGNLLNNIAKYASDSFRASISENEGKCIISFSNKTSDSFAVDTDKIFERTYRGDKARKGGGAGIGLYIVKLLAQKQNAEVRAFHEHNILTVELIFDEIF